MGRLERGRFDFARYNNLSNDLYIFAGGGTGGHLYPGLAVADEVLRNRLGASVVFACSHRAIDRQILEGLPYAVVPQMIRPAPRGAGEIWAFLVSWIRSSLQSRDMLRDLKPSAVLGLGGFAAVPLIRAAARAGVRCAMLNPDDVPGKANRHLARMAGAIFTQFESTAERFPPRVRPRVRAVGCPIRREFLHVDRRAAIGELGLRADRRTLLVAGGSLGAQSINQAVVALAGDLDSLADSWQVLHVTGEGKGGEAELAARAPRLAVRSLEYCRRMDLAMAAADVILCRGGASTLAEVAAVGAAAIVLPYPYHKDRQQRLNAEPLRRAGAALVVEDRVESAANAASLRETLMPLLADPSRVEAMRKASAAMGKPRAAEEVARWLRGEESCEL
jgi:UDP-N-acetylglucosamine--N-acetylmuramyl-(pentapeptide) pyrophosphoryl-undecaprenol N-acetylglucosamine transferase